MLVGEVYLYYGATCCYNDLRLIGNKHKISRHVLILLSLICEQNLSGILYLRAN